MKPEKIKQKTVAPLNMGGEIRAKKAVCQFDYYLKDSGGKWLPRLYLCEHRTLADIFLEAALFDPKKNVLCISKTEWESSPEEAKKVLRKFEKIFREPYQASVYFVRQLSGARGKGKSILLPVVEDARGMDRAPFLDERSIVRLCLKLDMPVCTVTFRKKTEPAAENQGNRDIFSLDVRPLFMSEKPGTMVAGEMEAAVLEAFSEERNPSEKNASLEGKNVPERNAFQERKHHMMRAFLKSELNVAVSVEICQCHTSCDRSCDERASGTNGNSDGVLRVDMSGITLEAAGTCYHRGPGALKSLAVYPGKKPETGERGTILVYPYYDRVFYLFTTQNEDASDIQAAVEQIYEIISGQ